MAERILKQFETLRRVTPSSAWQENTRAVLMESVKKSNLTNNAFREQNDRMEQWLTFTYRLRSFLPRPSRAISFVVVVMMFGTMAFATQASTPKDKKTYAVKQFYERVESAVAFTDQKAIETHLKHANNRKEEIVKLVEESKTDTQDQSVTSAIQEVVVSLTANIKDAQDTLDAIKEVSKEGEDSEVVALLAKTVTKGSQDALDTLKTAEQVDDSALAKTVEKAKTTVEIIETNSLNILVKEVTEVTSTSTSSVIASTTSKVNPDNNIISEEELKKLINNKIERVDKQIEETKTKLNNSVATGDLFSANTKSLAEKETIKVLTEAPIVAQEKLNEAKVALGNGSVTEALAKVNQSSEVVKESAKAIDVAGAKNQETQATKVVTPTTTPVIVPKVEDKSTLKSSIQDLTNDGKTATLTEVTTGKTDEFGQVIGDISQQTGL